MKIKETDVMSIRPNYYKILVNVRDYWGAKISATLECNDLISSLVKKNKLTFIQGWYYGQAIKYLFRINNKGDANENIDKAITCLGNLKDVIRHKE